MMMVNLLLEQVTEVLKEKLYKIKVELKSVHSIFTVLWVDGKASVISIQKACGSCNRTYCGPPTD